MGVNRPEAITRIFEECRTIAVVGLSSNQMRPSNGVSRYMRQHGFKVIAVNPNEEQVFGEKSFSTLEEVTEKIDLVNIFRRSDAAGKVVDDAIKIGAKAVWLQEGVIDNDAAHRALDAGLLVVMDRCLLKEHMKILV